MVQTAHRLLKPVATAAGTAKFIQLRLSQAVRQPQHKAPSLTVARPATSDPRQCLVLVPIQHQQRTSTVNLLILIMRGTWPTIGPRCRRGRQSRKFMKTVCTWVPTVLIPRPLFSMLRMMVPT